MIRRQWEDLPSSVHRAVAEHTGVITSARSGFSGASSELFTALDTATGTIFCKGITADNPKAFMHHHEATINHALPAVAPRLRWEVNAEGWLLLGFDYASGQHADLSPDSPDLAAVSTTVTALSTDLTPCPPVPMKDLAEQWTHLAAWRRLRHNTPADLGQWERDHLDELVSWEHQAFDAISGDTLLHTDLHAHNILINEERVSIIDWAWARRGAAWIDPAFLVIRLIAAGHAPSDAEAWAEDIPAWTKTDDTTRTAFAVAVLGTWEYVQRDAPAAHRTPLTEAARQWMHYRLGIA